jgi:hypothetical protein
LRRYTKESGKELTLLMLRLLLNIPVGALP